MTDRATCAALAIARRRLKQPVEPWDLVPTAAGADTTADEVEAELARIADRLTLHGEDVS